LFYLNNLPTAGPSGHENISRWAEIMKKIQKNEEGGASKGGSAPCGS
jgi:hypothetical protein